MQPLAALAGARCPQALVAAADGARASDLTRKTTVRNATVAVALSGAKFSKRSSHASFLRSSGGMHGALLDLPAGRLSLKFRTRATPEGEQVGEVLTLGKELEVDTEPVLEEENVVEEDLTPKAKVNFTLQQQCYFGQQFNVVGAIDELGNWDPAAAVPLEWSEGHLWEGEVAVPIGRTVEYKFLLTGKAGELEWQQGDNQVLVVKDESHLLVAGDWGPSDFAEGELQAFGEEPQVNEGRTTNGLGTSVGKESEGAVSAAVEFISEAAADVEKTLPEQGPTASDGNEDRQVGADERSAEIPFVEAAAVISTDAEVSGEVEDTTAAEL